MAARRRAHPRGRGSLQAVADGPGACSERGAPAHPAVTSAIVGPRTMDDGLLAGA